MNNVKAYTLLTSDSSSSLSKEVNTLLKDGWELYGDAGCSITSAYSVIRTYFQAMVKREMTNQAQN